MSKYTPFGAGTITVKIGSGTAIDYSGEVLGGAIGHAYSEVGETRTMMNGDKRSAQLSRDPDTIKLQTEADLTSAGLYAIVEGADLQTATVVFTPNTVGGAAWSADVILTLPEEIGADEYAAPLVAEYTWTVKGNWDFTAATTGANI
jgi:hypothetical protein